MKRLTAITLLLTLLFLSLTGCGGDAAANHAIRLEFDTLPKNVDPLLASTDLEQLLARSLFEPLVTLSADGTISCAAAESYTVSTDETVYTFTLRDSARWSDGQPVTASDFVFALRRAVQADTASSFAQELFCISGAEAVHSGTASADRLAAVATNENTLTITLSAPDCSFLQTLALGAGSPCREDFFESCGGRYGLARKYVVSNGPFYISSWVTDRKDNYLRITRSDQYNGNNRPRSASVLFSFTTDTDRITRISAGENDGGLLASGTAARAQAAGLSLLSYRESTCVLLLNTNHELMKNSQLRAALCSAAGSSELSAGAGTGIAAANRIVPQGTVSFNGLYHNGETSGVLPVQDDAAALTAFTAARKALKFDKLSALTLYCPDNEAAKTAASYTIQHWQKALGLYLTLTPVSNAQLTALVKSGNFALAVYPVALSKGTAGHTLSAFCSGSGDALAGYGGEQFDNLMADLSRGTTAEQADSRLSEAETLLCSQGRAIPLFYTLSDYAFSSSVTDAVLDRSARAPDLSVIGKIA